MCWHACMLQLATVLRTRCEIITAMLLVTRMHQLAPEQGRPTDGDLEHAVRQCITPSDDGYNAEYTVLTPLCSQHRSSLS
jgi:hypothetical protein